MHSVCASSAGFGKGSIVVVRRQAAIFVADVVGYSRMMAEDEMGTHERMKTIFDDIVPPTLEQFHGRLVKTMGDGVMFDFQQAVDAVECAASFQTEVAKVPATLTDEGELEFRIGINVGDIIVESNDIYGTPVNVAARLEGIAEPGGVAVSGSTYWSVKDKTEIQFEEVGFLNLKNIPYPIEVYRVVGHNRSQARQSAQQPNDTVTSTKKVWSEENDHLPSIVVLPLRKSQSGFATGVFLRWTDTGPDHRPLTVRQSGDDRLELGILLQGTARACRSAAPRSGCRVRAVTGAVQRAGEQVRINVQLHETKNGRQVWAERFQGMVENLFALQDEMVGKIVASLASRLTIVERERVAQKETGNISSYEAFLKGLHYMTGFLGADENEETLDECRIWLERAIDLDENYARPWGWLAYYHVQSWLHGWSDDEALKTAEDLARKAVALDPADHDTHWALGSVLFNSGKLDEARPAYEKALELNTNDADLHAEMADMLSYTGEHLGGDQPDQVRDAPQSALSRVVQVEPWAGASTSCATMTKRSSELGKILNPPSNEALLIIAASHAQLAEQYKAVGERG